MFVTPKIIKCDRTGRSGDSLPKVKVDVEINYSGGNKFTDNLELDASAPSALLSYPYLGSGERDYQSVKVRAYMPSCQAGRPYDLSARLFRVDAAGQTLAIQDLGGVRYKVPASQSLGR